MNLFRILIEYEKTFNMTCTLISDFGLGKNEINLHHQLHITKMKLDDLEIMFKGHFEGNTWKWLDSTICRAEAQRWLWLLPCSLSHIFTHIPAITKNPKHRKTLWSFIFISIYYIDDKCTDNIEWSLHNKC